MALTKKKADELYGALDGLCDPSNIVDPLCNLITDGESEDRESDSGDVQQALADFLSDVGNLIKVARAVGLEAEL